MRNSLMHPHPFAFERVGFMYAKLARSSNNMDIILGVDYEEIQDQNYIEDPTVGARINSTAIRAAMQRVLTSGEGAFHVHIHDHNGIPGLSSTDREELRPVMRSIRNAAPHSVHGLLILSRNGAYAEVLTPETTEFHQVEKVSVLGFPMILSRGYAPRSKSRDRSTRQSFLGTAAEESIDSCHVGIVGLGGGGSHIAQQLAHVGFSSFSLFDEDVVESSNLNRLVGGTEMDAKAQTPKVEVASRLIRGVNPGARIEQIKSRWQTAPEHLHACDIVFGCVDSYADRRDLETTARRYLIPYIDIGLDVHQCDDEPPRMAGQVILSMPDHPCMTCLGFMTDSKLAREAERYGAAGPRPQVVWANGVLASCAVGVAVDLITDWTKSLRGPVYLSYDSNISSLQPHKRLQYLGTKSCPHFPINQVGPPTFKPL